MLPRSPPQQRSYFNANYRPLIYELDCRGEQVLRELGRLDPTEALTWLRRGRESHTTFAHSVMICDALSSIELSIRQRPELRLIAWKEIQARLPDTTRGSSLLHCLPVSISHTIRGAVHCSSKALMPDAVFGIEYVGKGRRFFALECDRDHEPVYRSNLTQTSYLRKILQYRQVTLEKTYETHWGLPNLMVLNLTTSELHKNKILALVTDLTGGRGNNYLLFKTMPSLGDFGPLPGVDGGLLTVPWQRAGHEPFNISQP